MRGGYYFKNSFEYRIHKIIINSEGKFIILDLEITNLYRFTLTLFYAPNEDNPH